MTDTSEFFAVVGRQRACRRFLTDPVPDEMVETVLTAATHAPSAENTQPWEFLVVRDAKRRAALGEIVAAVWEAGARQYSEGRLSTAMLADVERGVQGGVTGAPVVVVVCADTTDVHPSALGASIFPATQNLLLAAGALGLGSAMTTLALANPAALRSLLELPAHVTPMAVIPLGWPESALGPPRRAPMAEKSHRDVYGTPW